MTIDTQHPEIALQMRWAHKALGTWEAVAKLCGNNPRTGLPVKSALAWWYASGRRPIPDAVIEAWQANVTPAMLKAWAPRRRKERVSIECSPEVRDALRNSIKRHDDTWNDAFKRILTDTEPGSVSHLFGMLGVQALFAAKDDLDMLLVYQEKGWWQIDPGYTDADIATVHWWLDRLKLELSMRKTPDWARED